jgi:peptidoglycan hydrolase CwlO-like protein
MSAVTVAPPLSSIHQNENTSTCQNQKKSMTDLQQNQTNGDYYLKL